MGQELFPRYDEFFLNRGLAKGVGITGCPNAFSYIPVQNEQLAQSDLQFFMQMYKQ
jgi:hypothetical protein